MMLKCTNDKMLGAASAAGAYMLWGVLPIYWKALDHVPAYEILAHRIIWSFCFMMFILFVTNGVKTFQDECRQIVSEPKRFFGVVAASLLISINWLTYIWAVNENRIIETSLGYYINPLVSVLLGIFVLKEKLSVWQVISFLLALVGVLNMAVNFGTVPWVALLLAISFALYGLFKKMVRVGSITGITLETLIVSPLALIYVSYLQQSGKGAFQFSWQGTSELLIGAGVVTAVPLILFACGANRLPLTLIGFLQYISPTIALILGIFLYHEPFTTAHLLSFGFIWLALAIFSLSRTKPFCRLESVLERKCLAK